VVIQDVYDRNTDQVCTSNNICIRIVSIISRNPQMWIVVESTFETRVFKTCWFITCGEQLETSLAQHSYPPVIVFYVGDVT